MWKNTGTGATVGGEFTNGGPGVERSILGAVWLNMIQRELQNMVTGAGIALDAGNESQLLQALLTRAPLNDAELTGEPTAPSPDLSDDSQRLANTGWVRDVIAAMVVELADIVAPLSTGGNWRFKVGPILVQGGNVATSLGDGDTASVVFPVEFDYLYGVFGQSRGTAVGGSVGPTLQVNSPTVAGFDFRNADDAATNGQWWIAVGRKA